jgi:hypothetical protein
VVKTAKPRAEAAPHLGRGLHKFEQDFEDEMTVNERMRWLVGTTEQAIVASPAALVGPAEIFYASARVEVASVESLFGDRRQRAGILNQPLPNPIPALCAFPVEQPAIHPFADLFHRNFLLLDLEQQLHPTLESILKCGE